jgi:transposase
VKPFVKGSKNDAVDAEAIFEAAMRLTMRFVLVKSRDQQDLQSLHRARDRLICQQTALINHTRGLLAEYGIVLPQGPWRFTVQAPAAVTGADLSDLARAIFGELLDQPDELDRRVKKLDAAMVALCRTNEACRRLAKLPSVGPVVATAIVAAVNDGRQFRSGREMAAWVGLLGRGSPDRLADRVPRELQLAHDLPDRLVIHPKRPPDPANRFHPSPSPATLPPAQPEEAFDDSRGGSLFGSDSLSVQMRYIW